MHRDIKPENILVGSNFVLKISDFSITQFVDPKAPEGNNTFHVAGGTEDYLCPQYYTGEKIQNIYASSVDIFSFICVIYYMITGKKLFNRKEKEGYDEFCRDNYKVTKEMIKMAYEEGCRWLFFTPHADYLNMEHLKDRHREGFDLHSHQMLRDSFS